MAHEVRTASGNKINWNHPPTASALCTWSKKGTSGQTVKGSFRSLCALNRANNLAMRKFGTGVEVIQSAFNTVVRASAGTHDFDACFDLRIDGVGWWDQQHFFRGSCGIGGWYRHPPLFGNHFHGFVLPPRHGSGISDDYRQSGLKVGKYVDGGWSTEGAKVTSSQIEDYYNHAFGLSGQHEKNSDKSWFPRDIEDTIFNLRAYVEKRAA